jgi:hypothetical protein
MRQPMTLTFSAWAPFWPLRDVELDLLPLLEAAVAAPVIALKP